MVLLLLGFFNSLPQGRAESALSHPDLLFIVQLFHSSVDELCFQPCLDAEGINARNSSGQGRCEWLLEHNSQFGPVSSGRGQAAAVLLCPSSRQVLAGLWRAQTEL